MANAADNAHADPRETERAREMWGNFTKLVKWSAVHVIVLLVLMAWFLL